MSSAVVPLTDFKLDRIVTAKAHSLLISVQELARKNGVHHVPVLHHERLVGMVCTCDMMFAPPDTQVRDVMKSPVTVALNRSLDEAASLMKERGVGSVVLLRGTTPCGIVTRRDVFSVAPDVAERSALPRCACCGSARHLRTSGEGNVLCIFCAGHQEGDEVRA